MELRMTPSEVLLKMVVVVESLRAQLTKLLKAGPHPVDPGTPMRPGACFVWHLGQPGLYFDFGLQEADHGDEVEKEEEEAEEAMEEEGQQEKAGPNQSFASYPASQEMDRDDEEGKQEEMKEEKQPARAAPNRLSEPFQEGDHDEEEEEE